MICRFFVMFTWAAVCLSETRSIAGIHGATLSKANITSFTAFQTTWKTFLKNKEVLDIKSILKTK